MDDEIVGARAELNGLLELAVAITGAAFFGQDELTVEVGLETARCADPEEGVGVME